ncbi:MAG: hypothetical protein VKK98_05480 [Cyanobacteriota bacterium]|nr:hypothetical protein [Cyanobacteriota bacterium]
MPWWFDFVLLGGSVALWVSGCDERDEVWGLFQKLLGVMALLVVILSGRQVVLELAGLALALWLPGASSRRLLSLNNRGEPIGTEQDSQDPDRR